MANYRTSRIAPVALVLVIVAIAIASLVSLARVVFFSGSSTTTQTDVSRDALLSPTAGRSVRMTVRGAIVANESFYSYQISVAPDSRSLTTYNGYLGEQVDKVSLTNNIPAYVQFIYALDKADLSKGTALTGDKDDTRGVCATGSVYEFEIMNAGQVVKRLWTSTCSGSSGSLDASITQLKSLFMAQIPKAQTLTSKINL